MKQLTWQDYYETAKAQAERLLPNAYYTEKVPDEWQQKEIDLLKETLHYEKFFSVVNTHKFRVEYAHGVRNLLGCSEKDFTIKKYYSLIHYSHIAAQMIGLYQLQEWLMLGKWPIQFMCPRYIHTVPLQHVNGNYLLFKRLMLPFQIDANFRLLSYLNEFTLIGQYNLELHSIRMTDVQGNTVNGHNELFQTIKKTFKEYGIFSIQELRILYELANNPYNTGIQVAAMLNVKESSVITYKKRILDKAERFFHRRFNTAKEVAAYLYEHKLI